jgi:hypothetical protein
MLVVCRARMVVHPGSLGMAGCVTGVRKIYRYSSDCMRLVNSSISVLNPEERKAAYHQLEILSPPGTLCGLGMWLVLLAPGHITVS